MISKELKQAISEHMRESLMVIGYEIQPVDYRTFNIRVPNEWGVPQYLTVQVKEII